jgi:hypothetical protein
MDVHCGVQEARGSKSFGCSLAWLSGSMSLASPHQDNKLRKIEVCVKGFRASLPEYLTVGRSKGDAVQYDPAPKCQLRLRLRRTA